MEEINYMRKCQEKNYNTLTEIFGYYGNKVLINKVINMVTNDNDKI